MADPQPPTEAAERTEVTVLPGWRHFHGGRVLHRVARVVVSGRLPGQSLRPACQPNAPLLSSASIDNRSGSWQGEWPHCKRCPIEESR